MPSRNQLLIPKQPPSNPIAKPPPPAFSCLLSNSDKKTFFSSISALRIIPAPDAREWKNSDASG
ncbi:uncharacterized protein ASCRUDRAFT_74549 [Ascoidea rubescens DSM 1968]|uniref:Uncharacterized protein n=1 Tax=Ascoidea rubescens DSM 1968 TaxID=1344418 RepID=A0A1D2VNK9_9ASCO|nr:hypothetical protein ASCRUDRAFT_74549 [Ascoidea rubescens DSM 1968]ODV63174.1 hypothetical protein ASCRUDRAFT_74549 [Ascoidea rubescens DSM 1968]